MTKQEIKIALYNELLSLKDEEITSNEIELMYYLSKDEEIQKILANVK